MAADAGDGRARRRGRLAAEPAQERRLTALRHVGRSEVTQLLS